MKRLIGVVLVFVAATAVRAADPLPLDEKRDTLTYGGYTFQKVYEPASHRWVFRATKDGKLVRTFSNPFPDGMLTFPEQSGYLKMGVVKAVGGRQSQVVLTMWTGGKNCCTLCWIVSVAPEFRVILDTSNRRRLDALEAARDIDGDGDLELLFRATTFDYFHTDFGSSPQADAWFKYDRKSSKFVAANDRCFPEIEKKIAADTAALESHSWEKSVYPDHEFQRLVLNVVIAYLYAGHDREAWEFFEHEYHEPDAAELRVAVEEQATADPFYQELLKRFRAR